MEQRKSRKIFTIEEIFEFCRAEYFGIRVENESNYDTNWMEFFDERKYKDELLKYDSLSESAKDEFNKTIRSVSKKYYDDFTCWVENIEEYRTDEDYIGNEEEYENRIEEERIDIINKICSEKSINKFISY